ncbi:hypothetical protein LP419_00525 [Massilia sp. H-1]|nr:hypothetical protein LP419_00525 [Massilia sp. H-1]
MRAPLVGAGQRGHRQRGRRFHFGARDGGHDRIGRHAQHGGKAAGQGAHGHFA